MKNLIKNAIHGLILGSAMIAGCENPPAGIQVSNTYVGIQNLSRPTSVTSTNAVCDPFGTSQVSDQVSGLWGKVFYWDPWWDPVTQTACTTARQGPNYIQGYIDQGTMMDVELFLNQLNVPTRPFNQGFVTQDGTQLLTPKGDTLYEYFALQLETVLKLSYSDSPGYYQFGILADDGAVLYIDEQNNGNFAKIVDDDGTHPTRMGCAPRAIYFDQNTRIPARINYYQGPRYHIASMLMWRKVDSATASLSEVQCGQEGNSMYFDSTVTPSKAQPAYLAMLSRGWHVLNPSNYLLPDGLDKNPCTQSCFTDSFQQPSWNTFVLSKDNPDPQSVKVKVNGVLVQGIYDSTLNAVYVPSYQPGQGNVEIGFCVLPVVPPAPAPTPVPGACFTDSFANSASNVFMLTNTNPDATTIVVTLNGLVTAGNYDPNSNSVTVPTYSRGSGTVIINYCQPASVPPPSSGGGSGGGGSSPPVVGV